MIPVHYLHFLILEETLGEEAITAIRKDLQAEINQITTIRWMFIFYVGQVGVLLGFVYTITR